MASGPHKPTRGASYFVPFPPPSCDLAAGKVWTRAQRSLGSLSSRDETASRLSLGTCRSIAET